MKSKVYVVLSVSALLVAFPSSSKAFAQNKFLHAYVTNFGEDTVTAIDVARGKTVANIVTGAKPHGVAIDPRGDAVYVSNEGDNTLSVIDPATNAVRKTVSLSGTPNQLAISPDGKRVFVTIYDEGVLAVVDTESFQLLDKVAVGRTPHIVTVVPARSSLLVTSEGDSKLVELSMGNNGVELIGDVPLFAWPRVLIGGADKKTAYQTIRWLNGVLVIDLESRNVVDRIALGEPDFAVDGKDAHGLAVTPDGRELWLTTQTTNDVSIIGIDSGKVEEKIVVGKNPNWIAFSPDGALAVVSNTDDDTVSILHVGQRYVVATVGVGDSPKRLAVGYVRPSAP